MVNGVGQAEIVMAREKFDRDLLWGLDRRMEIWRAPSGGTLRLERIYFLRYLEQKMQGDAQRIILRGPDANDLLARRIIDADAGSVESSKSGTADDVMKEYVNENLGGFAPAGRDIRDYGFSVQGDLSAAETVDKAASRRNLLVVCQELAESSRQLGTRLFFDIVHPTPSTFQFQTFTGQRGADRTQGTGQNPILLAPEMGNLLNPSLIQDWRGEATYGYGAGQGIEADRLVIETSDATRLAASIFNRREILFDGRSYSVQASLEDATEARLQEMRPRRQFSAELTDTFGFRFGMDWLFGDVMTAEYLGERFSVDTLAITGMVDGNGRETIRARLDNADD